MYLEHSNIRVWPAMMRTESSHEEGGLREFAISTKEFVDDGNGNVKALRTVRVGPPPTFAEIPNSEEVFTADLVLLAMGFTGPVKNGLLTDLGVELDNRGNVKTNESYMSSVEGVFAAGDMRRGQSLVVWAIAEGRKAARGVDQWLMGVTKLP